MTSFDIAVVAILLVSSLLGWWRGAVHEVLALLGWPIAFLSSNIYADNFVGLVPMKQEALRVPVTYALMFIAVLIVWSLLVWFLSSLVKAVGLGWLDRLLGGVFGVLRGGIVIFGLVWLAGLTHIPEQPFWRDAQMSKMLEDVALLTKSWLPDDVARRIHYRNRS